MCKNKCCIYSQFGNETPKGKVKGQMVEEKNENSLNPCVYMFITFIIIYHQYLLGETRMHISYLINIFSI